MCALVCVCETQINTGTGNTVKNLKVVPGNRPVITCRSKICTDHGVKSVNKTKKNLILNENLPVICHCGLAGNTLF